MLLLYYTHFFAMNNKPITMQDGIKDIFKYDKDQANHHVKIKVFLDMMMMIAGFVSAVGCTFHAGIFIHKTVKIK